MCSCCCCCIWDSLLFQRVENPTGGKLSRLHPIYINETNYGKTGETVMPRHRREEIHDFLIKTLQRTVFSWGYSNAFSKSGHTKKVTITLYTYKQHIVGTVSACYYWPYPSLEQIRYWLPTLQDKDQIRKIEFLFKKKKRKTKMQFSHGFI